MGIVYWAETQFHAQFLISAMIQQVSETTQRVANQQVQQTIHLVLLLKIFSKKIDTKHVKKLQMKQTFWSLWFLES